MSPCHSSPEDKRAQAKKLGDDLLRQHGKKKFYTVDEVKAANQRAGVPIDLWCWSHAMFNSHTDFDALHRTLDETCDFAMMKSLMVSAISDSDAASNSWFDWACPGSNSPTSTGRSSIGSIFPGSEKRDAGLGQVIR